MGIETVMRGMVNGTIAANRRPGSPTTDFRCLLNVRFSQKRKYRHAVLSDALGQKRTSEAAWPERNKVASQNDLVG